MDKSDENMDEYQTEDEAEASAGELAEASEDKAEASARELAEASEDDASIEAAAAITDAITDVTTDAAADVTADTITDAAADLTTDTHIALMPTYCTRSKGTACERCAMACPADAIYFNEESLPAIDAQACTRCGICLGICDGLSSTRITMEDLHKRMARIAQLGDDVYITCKENVFPGLEPASNVVVLPCLAMLSPEFWALLLAERICVRIAADLRYCADCDRAGGIAETLYTMAIETAQAWTEEDVLFSRRIPEKQKMLDTLVDSTGIDRRGAFNNLVSDVGNVASGKRRLKNSQVIRQFHEQRERARAAARLRIAPNSPFADFLPEGTVKRTLTPKRKMLLDAFQSMPEMAERVILRVSQTDENLCDGNGACTEVCPTAARGIAPDTGEISFEIRYCIGCGNCVNACPTGALSIEELSGTAVL